MPERELPKEATAEKTEQTKDYMEVYRNLIEMLKTNKNINFTTFGIGNISGVPGGDTAGRRAYQFDKEQGKLIESMRHSATFDRDVVDTQGNALPLYVKQPVKLIYEEQVILGFSENVRGDIGSPMFSDARSGNRFFAGIEGKRGNQLYTQVEMSTLGDVAELVELDPEKFLQMMEALCLAYIPEYYHELERLETKYKNLPS